MVAAAIVRSDNISGTRGKYLLCQLWTLLAQPTAQMLSKPLAPRSVWTHQPSFLAEWTGSSESYCLLALSAFVGVNRWSDCEFFPVKWDLSTIIHSFPVWGAEPTSGAFGNRYRSEAAELWLLFSLCRNTREPWNTEQHLVCEPHRGGEASRKTLAFVNISTT